MKSEAKNTIFCHDPSAKLYQPRMIKKHQAAAYCGLSLSGYQAWIDGGLVPGPVPGTKRYDRIALDCAIDKLSGISAASDRKDDYETWKEVSKRNASTPSPHKDNAQAPR